MSKASSFRAVQIADDLFWVGAVDWTMRNFHGYATHHGTTYNAYLLLADEPILIDTVKRAYRDEMLARIADVIDPGEVKFIISNHAELDHSGSLPDMIQRIKPKKVFASAQGSKTLQQHRLVKGDITVVKDGETLDFSRKKLTFIETRMLHWPDSMFTYWEDRRFLFSQDAFGMHLASSERFDDQLPDELLEREAAKYFANILLPYTTVAGKLFDKMGEKEIHPEMILPDHGHIWRKNASRILDLYRRWTKQPIMNNAVVVYDTMWGSTAKMATAVADGLSSAGVSAIWMPLSVAHRSDVAAEILEAGAFLVGSPTLNNNLFPTVADLLVYIKGLRRRGMIGGVFGSYGWGGEAIKQMEAALEDMNVERVVESIKVRYVPGEEDLQKCFEMGTTVAEELKRRMEIEN
jgi:flavorubredoxin